MLLFFISWLSRFVPLPGWSDGVHSFYFRCHLVTDGFFRDREVVANLQVHPKIRACPKGAREPQGGFRRDAALAVQDIRNPARWHTQSNGKPVGGKAACSKFAFQNSSRVYR